ncbi:MAG: IS110 family transposase [Patescibacteria group bacterium]
MNPILTRCAGLDVHQKSVTCTVLRMDFEKESQKETRTFATFKDELQRMATWLKQEGALRVVMESTGIYWRSVYEVLEAQEITASVVNARHVKNVPGRKTDVADSEWLADLCVYGLVRASFIPPKDLRDLRMLTRYRRKLVEQKASEKNRVQKVLESIGLRLNNVISDIDGVSARRMIDAIIAGSSVPEELVELCHKRLHSKKETLKRALVGEPTDRHRFILKQIRDHIRWLEDSIYEIDEQVVTAMQPYMKEWELLQTIPGINTMSAAMLLSEIGVDMEAFGSADALSSWAGLCPGNHETAGKKKEFGRYTEIIISKPCFANAPKVQSRRRANFERAIKRW